ncbi:hypothetical protein IQ266_08855 [filamentous cyanobacterium LEGE 11480]|uniref:histidine kinase n=1 Tax=Romeriopsis navalis LEGE 11480 TaxID=2777977 RepID=A0A928Z1Y7_9CYAN|nr:ATP-binding protein [Romeriopsis navalis]MBE9029836.1 hypothetical protein [Romeriopsis navalis LEGE 11480]
MPIAQWINQHIGLNRLPKLFCIPILLLVGNAATLATAAGEPSPIKPKTAKVLVVHSYHPELSWTKQVKAGIDQGFQNSEHNVTVYHEFLDAKRYPNLRYRQQFLAYLQTKYKETSLQLLMVADDPGLQLILEQHRDYFPQLPVIFLGANHVQEKFLNVPWMTGVFETHSIIETVLEAKRQTQSDHLIVISDSSSTGKANQQKIAQLRQIAEAPQNVVLIEDLTPQAIEQKLGGYPDDWPIFLAGQLRSERTDGALISFKETTETLRSQLPNPIYADSMMHVGHGAVGGKILSGSYHAQQAVQLVERFLRGTPVDQIEPILKAKNQWVFDARELQRLNLDRYQLPPESVLINRERSFYEQHRKLVWAAMAVIIAGTLTIIILANAIRRQQQAEKQLRDNEKQLEQRVADRTTELSETVRTLQDTQAQLIRTEKLSSLGQLAGGVAHEFNNPLTFIEGNLRHLGNYVQDLLGLIDQCTQQPHIAPSITDYANAIELDYIQQDLPKMLASMQSGTDRIKGLVCTLQKFSGADEEGLKPTDLNQSLDYTLQLLNAQIPPDIEVVLEYQPLPLVDCYPGELNQVFLAILLNAIEVMVASDDCHIKRVIIHTAVSGDNWVCIRIRDTGPGIPQAIQAKVFDPFFTTKPIGQGTGMGLALCHQTVQLHHGQLQLNSAPKQGTTVIIKLPIKSPVIIHQGASICD